MMNFLGSGGGGLRRHETWSPMCLPGVNDRGFFHTLIKYLSEDICLMFVSYYKRIVKYIKFLIFSFSLFFQANFDKTRSFL